MLSSFTWVGSSKIFENITIEPYPLFLNPVTERQTNEQAHIAPCEKKVSYQCQNKASVTGEMKILQNKKTSKSDGNTIPSERAKLTMQEDRISSTI